MQIQQVHIVLLLERPLEVKAASEQSVPHTCVQRALSQCLIGDLLHQQYERHMQHPHPLSDWVRELLLRA